PPGICHVFFSVIPRPPSPTPFPYTTLFRSLALEFRAQRPCSVRHARNVVAHVCDDTRLRLPRKHLVKRQNAMRFRGRQAQLQRRDRKSTRLNSSHRTISYAVFCLKKKKQK